MNTSRLEAMPQEAPMPNSANAMHIAGVSEIAFERGMASVALSGLPDRPDIASVILAPLAGADIAVDVLVPNSVDSVDDGSADFTFMVSRGDYRQTLTIIEQLIPQLGNIRIQGNDRMAMFSLSGLGMWQQPGVAKTLFETLAQEAIRIQCCVTSENKISVVIDDVDLDKAIGVLSRTFSLELLPLAGV
jgi:aspartate kinase